MVGVDSNHTYLFRAFRMEAPRDAIVPSSPLVRHGDSPLGVLPYLSGTQSRNLSNAPPPPPTGDRMLFKLLQFPYYLLPFPRTWWVGGESSSISTGKSLVWAI